MGKTTTAMVSNQIFADENTQHQNQNIHPQLPSHQGKLMMRQEERRYKFLKEGKKKKEIDVYFLG